MSERRLEAGARLVLASHNAHKLAEFSAFFAPYAITLVAAGALGLPEPEETEPDFIGNARLKAVAAARASGLPALADDSGFCVAALDGAPGVYSARWAGPGKDFGFAMRRVHEAIGETGSSPAWFIAVLCLAWPDGDSACYAGRVDGTTVWPPRGTRGFGYDPMFMPEGHQVTFGEMAPEQKEAMSHRARAFAQFVAAALAR